MRDAWHEVEELEAENEMLSAQADEAVLRFVRQEVLLPAFRKFRHLKTKGVYELLAEGLNEADKSEVVIYRNFVSGEIWVRPKEAFFDGRFEEIK